MKNFCVLILAVTMLGITACKKDYECAAKDSSGNITVLKCENCSKKEAESYEKEILEAGYTSASCGK